jgi:hypothetical protein
VGLWDVLGCLVVTGSGPGLLLRAGCVFRQACPVLHIAGLERGPVRHPDPRRVFREAWQQISLQANIAYEYANATAGHYWWRIRAAVYERTGLRI